MNPRLKENLWRIDHGAPSATLIVGGRAFEVPLHPALVFMKMRPYCTGHNSIGSIALKAGLSESDVKALLQSLAPSGILLDGSQPTAGSGQVGENVLRIVNVWSVELASSYIGNEIAQGRLSRTVLVGWLLEMYHYIKDFPKAIAVASKCAPEPLRSIYLRYREEETGHEVFVLRTLMRLGLTEEEVASSVPLVSTRSIGLLMKDLFESEPRALLIVAALVEAQEFDATAIEKFKAALTEHYGVADDALEAYFRHQEIDVKLGHSRLLEQNIAWIESIPSEKLDTVVDRVHDIKHAFDLQSLDIKDYYGDLGGRYFPRQQMRYQAIA